MNSNPIIFERIKALYAEGRIDGEKLAEYVVKGLITEAEAAETEGVAE